MNFDRPAGLRRAMTVTALACGLATLPALAQNAALATKSANELGLSLSSYKYTEPGVMSFKSTKVGFDYVGTYALGGEWPNQSKGWFLRGDARFATGKGDYTSTLSGNINNRPDWYYEIRGMIGKDFDMGDYTLSPYAGLGIRYLFNDLRGASSTGALGYRRESNYLTLPIGVTHRMALANQKQLLTTVEYSYLIRGKQDTKLSDTGIAGQQDVGLRQRSGYGLKLSTMVRFDTWSVGPTLSWWRVGDSDRGSAGTAGTVFEPRNNTYEYGIKGAYHF